MTIALHKQDLTYVFQYLINHALRYIKPYDLHQERVVKWDGAEESAALVDATFAISRKLKKQP